MTRMITNPIDNPTWRVQRLFLLPGLFATYLWSRDNLQVIVADLRGGLGDLPSSIISLGTFSFARFLLFVFVSTFYLLLFFTLPDNCHQFAELANCVAEKTTLDSIFSEAGSSYCFMSLLNETVEYTLSLNQKH